VICHITNRVPNIKNPTIQGMMGMDGITLNIKKLVVRRMEYTAIKTVDFCTILSK
jgi:hypothetical protein